jgi:hypothetical protein
VDERRLVPVILEVSELSGVSRDESDTVWRQSPEHRRCGTLGKGCAAAYFPEANPLVPLESFADKSMTPTSKSLIVSVQPAGTREPTT